MPIVELRVGTANVKTLDPHTLRKAKKVGLNTSAKMEFLDKEFAEAGYKLVGIQESCIQGCVTREQTEYIVITSGATTAGTL